MKKNLLTCTDVYKFGHLYQYPKGTTKVFSYLQARSDKMSKDTVFFGLQYFIKEYLMQPITTENVDEFVELVEMILGPGMVKRENYDKLVALGYMPLELKAVPEGTKLPIKNVLMTVVNTHPDFYWLVGFTESLLLKLWNTCTVGVNSAELRNDCLEAAKRTCDDMNHLPFQIHDFGYRGCSSEETAALSGAAHLLSFLGTDTVPAVRMIRNVYGINKGEPIGLSVPATEHSVMCAFGKEGELDAFKNMLTTYPKGIVSIVSDTYNLWNVLENFTGDLKATILEREGKVVFRPDSGNPVKIICGDRQAKLNSPEELGALEILWDKFGGTVNTKGYRVLNPKVGLIYGDGIYRERMNVILKEMELMKFASSNIVFGVGGLLLQNFNRDDQGFAIKATHVVVNGQGRDIMKDPITDSGKKSHTGYLALRKDVNGKYVTVDGLTEEQANDTLLQTVFKDGKLVKEYNFSEVRENLRKSSE